MEKVNLAEKLALISEHWRPKIVGELNGQEVKLVKFQGTFVWHHHENEDELFLGIRGRFRLEFRDRAVELGPGEFVIVPPRSRAPHRRSRRSRSPRVRAGCHSQYRERRALLLHSAHTRSHLRSGHPPGGTPPNTPLKPPAAGFSQSTGFSTTRVRGSISAAAAEHPSVGQARKATRARAFAIMALGFLSFACDRQKALQTESARWSLAFSDEFDGTSIDETKWNVANPLDQIINHELQAYVPEAVSVRSGLLELTANRGSTEYRGAQLAFTSGTVTTHGKFAFTFGRLVVRARLPRGQGLWPAFWLLPESLEWPPEIDLFEVRGQMPATLHQTIHWRDPARGAQFDTAQHIGPDFSVGFHEFRVDWNPDAIIWYVDAMETRRVTERVPSAPMYLNAALAVGGDFPGAPDGSTPFPAVLEIDSVRVFQLESSSQR